jgi:hypothetical protein
MRVVRPVAKQWVTLVGDDFQRVAFGLVLVQPVASREAGYEKLVPYMHAVRVDVNQSSDFSYQINRWRRSKGPIAGLDINRLSKWAVQRRGVVAVDTGGTPPQVFETGHALRVELDINTALTFSGTFSAEQTVALLEEAAELALEIAREGDVP